MLNPILLLKILVQLFHKTRNQLKDDFGEKMPLFEQGISRHLE
jgi:hypothetical protein